MSSLVEKILLGDAQAVVAFYHTYSPKINKFLQSKLPKEDVEEVTNDVFLEAIDSLSMLREPNHVLTWLYKIAHNKTIDFYRKRKIKSVLLSQAPFLEIVASEIQQPEFSYEKNKIRDQIESTLHSLSEKYQKILRLHYEEQIPIKETAGILNMSFKAAESLLFRARQSFKKTYERE